MKTLAQAAVMVFIASLISIALALQANGASIFSAHLPKNTVVHQKFVFEQSYRPPIQIGESWYEFGPDGRLVRGKSVTRDGKGNIIVSSTHKGQTGTFTNHLTGLTSENRLPPANQASSSNKFEEKLARADNKGSVYLNGQKVNLYEWKYNLSQRTGDHTIIQVFINPDNGRIVEERHYRVEQGTKTLVTRRRIEVYERIPASEFSEEFWEKGF